MHPKIARRVSDHPVLVHSPSWLIGQDKHLRDVKYTVHDLEVMSSNPVCMYQNWGV